MDFSTAPKLDSREEHFRIPGPIGESRLALWPESVNFLEGNDAAAMPA